MLVNLRALLVAIVDIILFRRGPESLPASVSLLAGLIVVNAALSELLFALFPVGRDMSAWELAVGILVPLLWYWVAFSLARKPERFMQTMIAFFGVNIVFQPMVAPLIATLAPYMIKQDPNLPPPAALSLLFFVVAIWALVVWVRVLRAAFEWPYIAIIIFIFGQAFAAIFVDVMLFGTPPKPV
jgi:hypothetical protein